MTEIQIYWFIQKHRTDFCDGLISELVNEGTTLSYLGGGDSSEVFSILAQVTDGFVWETSPTHGVRGQELLSIRKLTSLWSRPFSARLSIKISA